MSAATGHEGSALYQKVYGCLVGGLIGDALGAPAEGKTYQEVQAQLGELVDFEGVGTDDTAIRNILCDAIVLSGGHVTADEFAASFLRHRESYRLWWVPVRNMFHKLEAGLSLPVDAGWGNMQSSSSAMAISPMGVLNAANPRQAALETFDVAGLIHSGPTGFCRDAACGLAAAVAEAFRPGVTVESILAAGVDYLHPTSSAEIVGRVRGALALARETGDYAAFRARFYETSLLPTASDSRETYPATMAIFWLAGGDASLAIRLAANFGRDADTIATMVGGLAGAFRGAAGLRPDWVARVEANPEADYRPLARQLVEVVLARAAETRASLAALEALAGG